jgi:murein DD-endopeptidase MepM/ murein hydrolase activator NlpD
MIDQYNEHYFELKQLYDRMILDHWIRKNIFQKIWIKLKNKYLELKKRPIYKVIKIFFIWLLLVIIVFLVTQLVFIMKDKNQIEKINEFIIQDLKEEVDLYQRSLEAYGGTLIGDEDISYQKYVKRINERIEKYNLIKYVKVYDNFIYPVIDPKKSYIAISKGEYGWRYMNWGKDFHAGIDILSPYDSRIIASEQGKIFETGYNKEYGNYIIIDHKIENHGVTQNYRTFYGHLYDTFVEKDQTIEKGQIIGRIGSSGSRKYCYGIHLHFSIHEQKGKYYYSRNFVFNSLHDKKVNNDSRRKY